MRVLLIQAHITHYRLPVFQALGTHSAIDLSVIHSGDRLRRQYPEFAEAWTPASRVGVFKWQHGLREITQGFDAVVAPLDLRWLSSAMLGVARYERPALIYWGHGFGRSRASRGARLWLARRADAVLFYGEAGRERFVKAGLPGERAFVAPNTFFVSDSRVNERAARSHFLFVGRLQPRKRVDQLLIAIHSIHTHLDPDVRIRIVGDGEIRHELEALSSRLGITDRVVFHGEITDEGELQALYDDAIAYVSPGDVGLGVLHSFAYGVPIVTVSSARHGPEIENVQHDVNGILYEGGPSELAAVLKRLTTNPEYGRRLGRNAFLHYSSKRQPQQMIEGFVEAIAFATATNRS